MTKKRKSLLIWLTALTLIIASGITFAFMFVKTGTTTNQFTESVVSCQVSETFDSAAGTKSSVKVRNTGNIPSYLRIRLVSNWIDSTTGKIVGKSSEMPLITPAAGWIQTWENTYCCVSPVAPGQLSPEFLSGPVTLAEDKDLRQSLEIIAEAVQSEPAQAVSESWNVTISGGQITGASVSP